MVWCQMLKKSSSKWLVLKQSKDLETRFKL